MKYPRKYIKLECKDESDEVVGYAPVKGVLFSENKEYSVWGTTFSHYIVSSEVVYHSILNEFVKNDYILVTKHKVYEAFDNYDDCKQSCVKENEGLLSQIERHASIEGNAHKFDSAQMARYIEKTQKKYKDMQNEIFENTDKLYAEKSKSLDGSKAKQVVQKVKNNNKADKENQGK